MPLFEMNRQSIQHEMQKFVGIYITEFMEKAHKIPCSYRSILLLKETLSY